MTVASKLKEEGINTIGIPQTIDNDICGTDNSIGFHSAVKNIVETRSLTENTKPNFLNTIYSMVSYL